MRSSLSYAILALLSKEPQTGYEIGRQMRLPQGFLWQAKHGQIYPELASLAKARLLRFERIDTGSGPPRKVHSLTAAGRAELLKWIVQNPHDRPANDELVIKAYAITSVPHAAATALLNNQLATHDARLATLELRAAAIESMSRSGVGTTSSRFGEYAAVRRAIGAEREYLSWCRWLLGELLPKRSKPALRPGATLVKSGTKSRRNHA
jgi:PadR family transcriptional regulator AphA